MKLNLKEGINLLTNMKTKIGIQFYPLHRRNEIFNGEDELDEDEDDFDEDDEDDEEEY